MGIRRLAGPRTHICWTPDSQPKEEREQVSLVREEDLAKMEKLVNLTLEFLGEDRLELEGRRRAGESHIGILAPPGWRELMSAAYDVMEIES